MIIEREGKGKVEAWYRLLLQFINPIIPFVAIKARLIPAIP
jgi:hypothetical protein